MTERRERGAASIMVAGALVFLFGAAALAVDVSAFQHSARTSQTTADMSCMAGVVEETDADRIEVAAAITKQNWPAMEGQTVTFFSGNTAALTNGTHTVSFEASYGGAPNVMRVVVTEGNKPQFGALFTDRVDVVQSATCSTAQATEGPGALPFGALVGTFSGDLFDCGKKITGNCGALRIDGNGGDVFRDTMTAGGGQELEKHHGDGSDPDGDTGHNLTNCPEASGPCSRANTETGNMEGPFNQGLATRLSNIDGATCQQNGDFNCDSLTQVLGGNTAVKLETLWATEGDVPADFPRAEFIVKGWQESLYGAYADAKDDHYWYDGGGIKCDSPRLGTVPIVVYDDDWALGDGGTNWPNGSKKMKIVGFYTVYIDEPDDRSDIGNGNATGLGHVTSNIIWFGPNATCDDGSPFAPVGTDPDSLFGGVSLTS